MRKNLLDTRHISKNTLKLMNLDGETFSTYSDKSLEILKVLLKAYDQGIEKMTSDEITIAFYNMYKKIENAKKMKIKLCNLCYCKYITYNYENRIKYYSLVKTEIEELRYEVTLRGHEHNPKVKKKIKS